MLSFARDHCAIITIVALLACAGLLPSPAAAQTPDEPCNPRIGCGQNDPWLAVPLHSLEGQYIYHLSLRCAEMGFARTSGNVLLPGQAGPRLEQFCSASDPTALDTGTYSTGATGGSATGVGQDTAARRRASRDDDAARAEREPDVVAELPGRYGVFASFRHADETQDPGHFEGGRSASLLEVTLGVDRWFTATSLAGAAVVLEDQSGRLDAGGDFGHRGYGALLYGSWAPTPQTYVDISTSATRRNGHMRRIVSYTRMFHPDSPGLPSRVAQSIAAAPVRGDVGTTQLLADLQAGHDLRLGGNTIGPRLALQYRHTRIGSMVESGETPMALVIHRQTRQSLRTGTGLQASRVVNADAAVFVMQLNADWWHEFEDNQRFISAHLVEDLRPEPSLLRYQNAPPDRDVFTVRASIAATMRRGWSAFLAADALLGHDYLRRLGVAIGLRKEL